MSDVSSIPVALSVAGSDCSAGAGIQADLKAFSGAGVYGLTAVTCVVSEIPGKVTRIDAVDPAAVSEQIRVLREGFPIAAAKTGMLFSKDHIAAVVEHMDGEFPWVVDPVMVATSGDSLLESDAVAAYREQVLPRAIVITPNMDEARVLLDRTLKTVEDLHEAARELADEFGTNALVKGGHLGGDVAVDVLAQTDGSTKTFEAPFYRDISTHGTGCTYSAAIAARLARGDSLVGAISDSKSFVTRSIRDYFRWKQADLTVDALNHFAHETDA